MENWNEIKQWRKARRDELVARRAAFETGQRHGWNERISAQLESIVPVAPATVIGYCWPFKGEFDARFVVRRWRERGVIAALPEVVEKNSPLRFRKWWPGAPMMPGLYGIPVPNGTEVLTPDVAIVPMNGFDGNGNRLGYGGGYFDRTLAALGRRMLTIGASYEALRLDTIYPQPHDIPMDFVVTEAAIYRGEGSALAALDAAGCVAAAKTLLDARRLPRRRYPAPANAVVALTENGYSSPACYAHEIAPEYSGEAPPMPAEEVVELLNVLLEAERAGARVLAAFLEDYERDAPARRRLAAVQRDEAANCAILIDLIRRVNGAPSHATGEFLGKALAIEGRAARLQFLNRGQRWVARKIGEALPRLNQDFVRGTLFAMRDSHLLNIEACDALAETLET